MQSTILSRAVRSAVLAMFAGLLGACAISDAQRGGGAAGGVYTDHFADNGLGNAVAVVAHPAGEYRDGITYVTYQGPLEDPYVAAYNHQTGQWDGPYRAGTSELGRMPLTEGRIDNHGRPAMIIDQEGYIHIFYGGHGGSARDGENPLGNTHNGANRNSVSARPYDITEWVEVNNVSPFGTYNQAVMMDNGDIYLFYRHGAHRSDWVYQKSSDNGRTFEEPVSLLKHQRRDDVAAVDSWYPYVRHGNGDELIISFDYHLCWDRDGAPDHRGHTPNRHHLYYMVFDTSQNALRNVLGQQLPMPLTREVADEMALVVNTGDLWVNGGAVTLDPLGRPHIAIAMGEDIGLHTGGPKRMRHIRWNGEQWVGGHANTLPIASGDLLASSADNVSFLLPTRNESRLGEVSWWNSNDGGESFAQGEVWLSRQNSGFRVSSLIRNAHPDARVLVAEMVGDTNDRRMYLLGNNGPVRRRR